MTVLNDRDIILSTKAERKMGVREILCYIIGLFAGIFLIVYPGRILYKVFGIAIILCEIMLYVRSSAEHKSFVEIREKMVCGRGFTSSSNKLTEFTVKYSHIKRVYSMENFVMIETKDASYKCSAGGQTAKAVSEISSRIK